MYALRSGRPVPIGPSPVEVCGLVADTAEQAGIDDRSGGTVRRRAAVRAATKIAQAEIVKAPQAFDAGDVKGAIDRDWNPKLPLDTLVLLTGCSERRGSSRGHSLSCPCGRSAVDAAGMSPTRLAWCCVVWRRT